MVGLNRVQLIWHLGCDPELKTPLGGMKVCDFSMAENRRWHNSEGEVQEVTEWFNIETWNRLTDVCAEYLN